jgi:hypothetical protein
MTNDAFVKNVASQLIEQIRRGTAPWQKPWEPGTSFIPFNPTNGTRYKGINVVNLLSRGYSDARWMTYRQALAVLYNILQQQSSLLSYVYGFRFCVLVCLLCAALALLSRKSANRLAPAQSIESGGLINENHI